MCIGVPPVKKGFGVLKSGTTIIYRGMWENGKFEGKGKLTFGDYSYEGDFYRGLFDGYGKLQVGRLHFMGRFEGNRAEGEGTYLCEDEQVHGFWQNNCLIQKY